jgi:hypothetical protein
MAKATAKKPTPVEKKLVGVADIVITAADRSRDPALSIPVRSLAKEGLSMRQPTYFIQDILRMTTAVVTGETRRFSDYSMDNTR